MSILAVLNSRNPTHGRVPEIKMLRQALQCGLKEAKDFNDAMRDVVARDGCHVRVRMHDSDFGRLAALVRMDAGVFEIMDAEIEVDQATVLDMTK